MSNDKYDELLWHALNYRNSAAQHAEEEYKKLADFVNRRVAEERERCAKICEALGEVADCSNIRGDKKTGARKMAESCAAVIRRNL
jgi:hypothetical protein